MDDLIGLDSIFENRKYCIGFQFRMLQKSIQYVFFVCNLFLCHMYSFYWWSQHKKKYMLLQTLELWIKDKITCVVDQKQAVALFILFRLHFIAQNKRKKRCRRPTIGQHYSSWHIGSLSCLLFISPILIFNRIRLKLVQSNI